METGTQTYDLSSPYVIVDFSASSPVTTEPFSCFFHSMGRFSPRYDINDVNVAPQLGQPYALHGRCLRVSPQSFDKEHPGYSSSPLIKGKKQPYNMFPPLRVRRENLSHAYLFNIYL